MVTLKNIAQTILLITYLSKRIYGDNSSEEETKFPDLNNISADARREIDICINKIHSELKYGNPSKSTRVYLPKKIFGTINYDDLKTDEAKAYFSYLLDLVTPKTRTSVYAEPYTMLPPKLFCERKTSAKIDSVIEYRLCMDRLSKYYEMTTDDINVILKTAFKHLVYHEFYEKKDYAYDYYEHMIYFLGFTVPTKKVGTAEEFCMGKVPSDSKASSSNSKKPTTPKKKQRINP